MLCFVKWCNWLALHNGFDPEGVFSIVVSSYHYKATAKNALWSPAYRWGNWGHYVTRQQVVGLSPDLSFSLITV